MPDIFRNVDVDHLVQGRTRVTWRLDPEFCAPGPWRLKLQWGHTGDPDADDWADVADWADDVGQLVDPESRDDLGTAWRVHYRVCLQAGPGSYTSRPVPILGTLDVKHWQMAQAIVRKETLRMRKADAAQGWLLKRKREGVMPDPASPTTAATGFLTGDVVNSRKAATAGTEWAGGFYAPVPYWVDFTPAGTYETQELQARATVDDAALVQQARVLCDPLPAARDAIVVRGSDERFYLHPVRYGAIVGRRPLVATVELHLAPRSDVLYTVPVPDVDPFPEVPYCG